MPIVEAHPNRQADRMGIGALDRALERAGRHHPAGAGAKILADLCSPYASVAEGIAAAVAMRKQGRRAAAVALAAPVAIAVGNALKHVVHRPRPASMRFRRKGRQSFPSTHVAAPLALISCLWWAAPPTVVWRSVLTLCGGAVVAVAVERVCAGAHWPSDVAAGALLGGIVGSAIGLASRPKGETA
ncbi:MAG: phosphatase PAP2 family protein [Deltaproteobacteria bacterium]|nr:MAG: phosphatase PAP2 family protein [Deltaproteobacteria bacterium]